MQNQSKTHFQRGFVLATVLVLLLILVLIVSALLSGQAATVRQMRDTLAGQQAEQDAHNLHRACLNAVRAKMSINTLSQVNTKDLAQPIVIQNAGTCQVRVYDAVPEVWTPRFEIVSTPNVGRWVEISHWRYPACGNPNDSCFTAPQKNLNLRGINGILQATQVRFAQNQPIQTTWRAQ